MRNAAGFTLIEILLVIVVTGLLASTLLLGLNNAAMNMPRLKNNAIADQAAKQCIEWFLGQRRLIGYSAFSCPSTTVPTFCSAPSGYSVTVNVVCTTINTDTNYKTITVTVSGPSTSSFSTLVADY